jgi:hypothetical protein
MKSAKLKLAAAAVAAMVAAPAFAAIDNFATGNGELFLTVYNPTVAAGQSPVSYYFDLTPIVGQTAMGTFNLNNFLPTGVAGQIGTNFNWTISGTDGWSQFVSNAGPASQWKWQVVAGDSTGSPNVIGQQRYLSTSADPLSTVDDQTNSNLNLWSQASINYVDTINTSASAAAADGSGTFLQGAGGLAYFGDGMGERWGSRSAFETLGNVGQSLGFYYLTGRPATTSLVTEYAGNWTFAQNQAGGYDLIYSAVPEPGELALMLAGLSVLGMVTRRRRAKSAA